MADDRIAALRRGYEAFNRGDLDSVFVDVGPDLVVKDRAELPDPRTHHGLDGAAEAMRRASEGFEEYRVDPEEFIEVGDHVVVVARQSGRGSASGVERARHIGAVS